MFENLRAGRHPRANRRTHACVALSMILGCALDSPKAYGQVNSALATKNEPRTALLFDQPFSFGTPSAKDTENPSQKFQPQTRLTPIDPRLDARPASFASELTTARKSFTQDLTPPQTDDGAAGNQEVIDITSPPERQFEPTGKIEWIRQRYPDGKVQVEREVSQDAEGNYFNHGNWRLFNPTGQVLAEGLFQKGLMEGPWQRWHAANDAPIFTIAPFNQFQAPFLSTATFHRGKLDGVWNIYDASRRKIMEITYREGQRHGLAIWWFPNGVKMREVAFNQGIIDGPLMEWDQQNKAIRNEEYIRGQKVVIETKQFSNQQKQFEQYFLDPQLELDGLDQWWEAKPAPFKSNGERLAHGPVQMWYDNGQPQMAGQFAKGNRQGQFTWWHRNGQKQLEGQFEQGQKVGQWTWWHANGFKATQGTYVADIASGDWIWWTEEGTIASRETLGENSRTRVLSPPKSNPDKTTPILPSPKTTTPTPGTDNGFEEVEAIDRDLKIEGSVPPNQETQPNKNNPPLANPEKSNNTEKPITEGSNATPPLNQETAGEKNMEENSAGSQSPPKSSDETSPPEKSGGV